MGSSNINGDLHIFFFPFLASGHMIPLLDMAFLFAERGVKVSYITTAGNLPALHPAVSAAASAGLAINLLLLPFPSESVGLPAGCENTNSLPMSDDALEKFYKLIQLLDQPLRQLIIDHHPDCLVADDMYPWTSDLAISLSIPRVVFNGTSHFTICVLDQIEQIPNVTGYDNEDFVFDMPGELPDHEFRFTKSELPKAFHYPKLALDMFRDSINKSFGYLLNSVDELAPEYVAKLKMSGHRVWNVGPVSLPNRRERVEDDDEGSKGIKEWLDRKNDQSVLYVAFGSECTFSDDQLREIAFGLEASSNAFVWVVRGQGGGLDTIQEWLPKEFEEKVEGRGLIVRGWAPQRLILNHPAVGGFVTHCGWNSTMEALTCGLPMISWPLHSEQFVNERLIVQVLKIGVSALEGVKRSIFAEKKEMTKAEGVKRAVERVMVRGEDASEMRRRSEVYKEMLRSVTEEGGSSYVNLTCMINELSDLKQKKENSC